MHQSVFYVSVFYVSLKFAPPVQGTPFTLGNLPAGLSEKLKPSAGYYRASGLCIPFQKLPGMTSTGKTNPSEQPQPCQQGCSELCPCSACTQCWDKAQGQLQAHLHLTACTGLTGNTRKSKTSTQLGVEETESSLVFLAGTEKTLLSSEGSTW